MICWESNQTFIEEGVIPTPECSLRVMCCFVRQMDGKRDNKHFDLLNTV